MPRRPLHAVVLLIALAASVVVASCDRSSAQPPTLAASSPRVVALSPAIASTLRFIGSGSIIVGRHGFDEWSDQSIPPCGDEGGIDYETLIKARPTDVLLQSGAKPPPERLMSLAKANGWHVQAYPLLTLDDIRSAVVDLIRRFPPPPPAAGKTVMTEASLTTAMDRAWSRRGDGPAKAGRVLMLVAASPQVWTLGPGSFHQQVLERLGGVGAITEGKPDIVMDAEDVLRLRPDAIVFFVPRAKGSPSRTGVLGPDDRRALLGPLAGLHIPAVRNGRVALIDDPECRLPGTSMIRVADDLVEILARFAKPAP